MFAAFVNRECSVSLGFEFDDLDPSEQPAQVLMRIGVNMSQILLSETGLAIYRLVVAEADKFPGLAEVFYRAGPAPALLHLSQYFERAARQGLLDVEDTNFAAEEFFALLQTDLCMKRRLGLIPFPSVKERDYVVQQAVLMFLNRYGSKKANSWSDA